MDLFSFDEAFYEKGYRTIAGVDESGRGPWAGPVVAAAVIFPPHLTIPGVNDSKKLTPEKREELFPKIHASALAVGVSIVSHQEIDELNILQASFRAMRGALSLLSVKPELVLVDGHLRLPEIQIPQEAITDGDQQSGSIAAASIIAKVTRDRMMVTWAKEYPQYGFEKHKGYGTKQHQEALLRFGPCPIHRRSFGPVRRLLGEQDAHGR